VSLDAALETAVTSALEKALGPYLRRLSDPEPVVYSVREAAHVLCTSTTTVRRLVDEGVLRTVPHMGQRIVIPRAAVTKLVVARTSTAEPVTRLRIADRG
jgi:excisionase family DNA binding protein